MSTATAALGTTMRRGDQVAVTLATSLAADDIIDNAGDNLFAAGDLVRFTALTGGTGLTALTKDYYVIAANLSATTFQVATTSGGSAVDFSADITAGTVVLVGAAIAQIQDVTGPALSTDTDEITNHDSPGGVEEFIPTIKRTGEITFPLVFLPTNATHDATTGVINEWEDKSLTGFSLRYPDNSGWNFNGYVTGFSQTAPVAGHVAGDVTVRPSGAPTYISNSVAT